MPSLFDYLSAERHRQFVGREAELTRFQSALDADEMPFHVLYVHGPGGVGKTALLQEFKHRCGKQGVSTYYLDARTVEPSAADFVDALRTNTGLDVDHLDDTGALSGGAPGGSLPGGDGVPGGGASGAARSARAALFVDTFESVAPLERWMREDFLPRLPVDMLLVLSGRQPPPPSWRADVGLSALIQMLPLRNLSPAESRRYLKQRGIPEARRDEVLRFAHGHPLALSLVADVLDQRSPSEADTPFEPVDSPDVVGALLRRFLDDVPSPQHRAAIEACALVHATTETLLAHLMEERDVRDLFEWLRTLSFIEAGRAGLFPHDAAREALVADLRWRNPEKHEALHRRARQYYSAQLRQQSQGDGEAARDPERVLTDYIFLYRDNPVVRPFFTQLRSQWHERGHLVRDDVKESDWPHLEAMTERHEGEAAAAMLRYWRGRQPGGAYVFRDAEEEPAGFVFPVRLEDATDEDRTRDPAVEAACAYLDEHAPLRGGERATLFRFWMDRDEHQALSPVQSLIAAYRVRYYLSTPHLAYTFLPCADPDFWALVFAYADFERLGEAAFQIEGRGFGMFGHDWRTVPPAAWLNLLAERNITPRDPEAVPPPARASMLVLSEVEFGEAVKDALQEYVRPDALRGNPLLRSRLIVEKTDAEAEEEARIDVLRELIEEAAEALSAAPREAKFYRALRATYLDPEPTQERAAEKLDLPFSTFRRHLKSGIEHVAEALWQQETGG